MIWTISYHTTILNSEEPIDTFGPHRTLISKCLYAEKTYSRKKLGETSGEWSLEISKLETLFRTWKCWLFQLISTFHIFFNLFNSICDFGILEFSKYSRIPVLLNMPDLCFCEFVFFPDSKIVVVQTRSKLPSGHVKHALLIGQFRWTISMNWHHHFITVEIFNWD